MIKVTSPFKIWIGIDPARAGAVTVIAASPNGGAAALLVVAWKKVTRAKRRVFLVDIWRHTNPKRKAQKIGYFAAHISRLITEELYDLVVEMGYQIEDVDFTIATEDAYVGKSARTGLSVARFGGQVAGVLEGFVRSESLWIRAAEWRKPVLNLNHFTKREIAKAASLAGIPPLVLRLRDSMKILGDLDHITDSAGVALWAKDHNKK